MISFIRATIVLGATLAAAACGEETGPRDSSRSWRSFVMVERWQRHDPPAQHTIVAFVSFHQDDPMPRFIDVDPHCGVHEGTWEEGQSEPGFGTARFRAPDVGEVTFTVASPFEPSGGSMGWDTGDPVRVIAPGGELPGFELDDVVPAPVQVTSHDLANLDALQLVVPRRDRFDLTWTPTSDEVFVLFLQFRDAAHPVCGVLCFFPGADGAGSVSPEVLGHLLPTSDAVPMTNVYVSGASRQRELLDDVEVQMVTWNGTAARIRVE